MNAVEVNRLVKSYPGKLAVNDISFSVAEGEILGLIGPNGAGKSTTIKSILGFLRPDSGEISLFGRKMDDGIKNQLGYLPEEKGLYRKIRVIDLIVYLASLKGLDKAETLKRADLLLEKTGMAESRNSRIEELSKGMSQLIQFVITIVHDPKLIILDEPFSGLDPVNSAMMKQMIRSLKEKGRTILLSTHQMNEVEALSDRILMIHKGSAVLYGNLDDIRSEYQGNSVFIDKASDTDGLKGITGKHVHKETVELMLDKNINGRDILVQLMEKGMPVTRFEVGTPSLNDIFIMKVNSNEK